MVPVTGAGETVPGKGIACTSIVVGAATAPAGKVRRTAPPRKTRVPPAGPTTLAAVEVAVSVAALLVARPVALTNSARKREPSSPATVAGVV